MGLHVHRELGKGLLAKQDFPRGLTTWFGTQVLGIEEGKRGFGMISDGDTYSITRLNTVDSEMRTFFFARADNMDKMDALAPFARFLKKIERTVVKTSTKLKEDLETKPGVLLSQARLPLKGAILAEWTDPKTWCADSFKVRTS